MLLLGLCQSFRIESMEIINSNEFQLYHLLIIIIIIYLHYPYYLLITFNPSSPNRIHLNKIVFKVPIQSPSCVLSSRPVSARRVTSASSRTTWPSKGGARRGASTKTWGTTQVMMIVIVALAMMVMASVKLLVMMMIVALVMMLMVSVTLLMIVTLVMMIMMSFTLWRVLVMMLVKLSS